MYLESLVLSLFMWSSVSVLEAGMLLPHPTPTPDGPDFGLIQMIK